MRENIRACVQAVAETLTIPQPLIEIGSFQVEGQSYVANLRPLFADSDYTGCDMRPGPGVDRIRRRPPALVCNGHGRNRSDAGNPGAR